jgi:carbonyl reductase 1
MSAATAASAASSTSAASAARRIVLVTGANKGIGLAIVESLLEQSGLHVLLGARDQQRGEEAVKALSGANKRPSDVEFLHLDVLDDKSVSSAAATIRSRFGGLDVLINNAGIAWKGDDFNEEVARTTCATNYYGMLRMLRAFTPLLREIARVVNVSSSAGQSGLRKMSDALRQRFLDESLTVDKLSALVEEFIAAVKAGDWKARGWPDSTYSVSKAAATMLTRIWTKEIKAPNAIINGPPASDYATLLLHSALHNVFVLEAFAICTCL